MDEKLLRTLAEHWDLDADRAEPLTGGDDCAVWRVSESLVLRVAADTRTPNQVLWSCDAAAALSEQVPEVVAPILTVHGATAHERVSVWPFVPGERADRDDPSIRDQAAELLARLHTVNGQRERGIVHGDYYRGNLLVDGGYIVGLVDWDEARVDNYVTEFAWSMWEFAKSPDGTTMLADRADRFAEVYRQVGGRSITIDEAIPWIRDRLAAEIERSRERRDAGLPADEAYEAAEIEALRNLS
jgi:aminoglycoside phosphotransferase (APT) family kinase protein